MPDLNSKLVDTLHLPLEELATLSMRRLRDYGVLERASKSTLYCDKWKLAGIRPEDIRAYEDFTRIPFTTSRDLRKAIDEGPIDKVLCSEEAVHWFSPTGTTGMPKSIPMSQRDIEFAFGYMSNQR